MDSFENTYKILYWIYDKHRRKYRENGDSRQMCCMWSTNDPPDDIEGTDPFVDIEKAFGIVIAKDNVFELYDMNLEEAAKRIMEIQKRNQ